MIDFAKETLKASDPNLLQNLFDHTQTESMEKTVKAKSGLPDGESTRTDTPASASDAASEEEVTVNASSELDATSNRETENLPKPVNPLVIDKPYPPTMYGLESALMQCRFMMNRIISEVCASRIK